MAIVREHPNPNLFPRPADPNARIWRYTDLTKFLRLVTSSRLHFSRLGALDDPAEGTLARLANRATAEKIQALFRALADRCAVSCWHLGEEENASMWRAYVARREGVVVQSTVSRLVRAITDEAGLTQGSTIYVGMVRYVDSKTVDLEAPLNAYAPVLWKRAYFRDERELRAVLALEPGTAAAELVAAKVVQGVEVPVQLPTLIETVRLAPATPQWVYETVSAVVAGRCPVEMSALDADWTE